MPGGARPLLLADAWYGPGAEMPVLVLPPGRNLDELDLVLDALRPSGHPRGRAARR